MPTIAEVRQKYPQYNDMSDEALADALHQKYYSDMPKEEFQAKIGLQPREPMGDWQSSLKAFAGGGLEGVPVVGPSLRGGADALRAGVESAFTDDTYEQVRARREREYLQSQQEHPYLNTAGQITGAIAGTAPLVATAPGAFGVGGASMPARIAASTVTNAALGGVDAASRQLGESEATGVPLDPEEVAKSAGLGAAFGAAGPPVAKLVGAAAGRMLSKAPKIPTTAELGTAKQQAYQAVDSSGVRYSPKAFNYLASIIESDNLAKNISPTRHPKAFSMMEDIKARAATGKAPTITELDQLRQEVARDVANAPDKAERYFGTRMIKKIDEFIDRADNTMATGDPQQTAAMIREARALNARSEKAKIVDELMDKATRQAARAGSGGNINNATRQQFEKILNQKRLGRGFTAEEKDAVRQVVMGPGQKYLRLAGKLSPSGNGLMAALGIGATAANPLMAIAPATGMAAKATVDAMTAKNARLVSELVRAGGKLPERTSEGASRLAQALLQGSGLQAERDRPPPLRVLLGPPQLPVNR
jgi:hypothetical protein